MTRKIFTTVVFVLLFGFFISCRGTTETSPSFSITFLDYNDSVLATYEFESGADLSTLPTSIDPSRPGYLFVGWSPNVPPQMPANHVTVIAQYAPYLDYVLQKDAIEIVGLIEGIQIFEVIVPESIDGKPVTSIAQYAFSGVTDLQSITLPNSVETIGFSAFWGTSNLVKITLPFVGKSREGGNDEGRFGWIFGDNPFPNSYEAGGYWLPNSLVEVEITSTNSIGDFAFDGASKLTSITLPNGVLRIGNFAFRRARQLTSIAIPSSVTAIGSNAFSGCDGLMDLFIPASVASIDGDAFMDCFFSSITVDEANLFFSSQDGILFDKEKTTLLTFPPGKGLSEYQIPETVTSIQKKAFYLCTSLGGITIPAGVSAIGVNAFYNCFNLTGISVDEANLFFSSQDGVLYNDGKTVLITYPIAKSGGSFSIPASVARIEDYAFWGCVRLSQISLPENLTYIGDEAFNHVFQMTNLSIPASVTSIGKNAFFDCLGLTSLTVPASVASIGSGAFHHCDSLTLIEVEENNPFYCSQDGVLFDKEKTTLIAYPAQKAETNYSVPASVTSISDLAFYYCWNLQTLSIPASVTIIGNNVFENCIALSNITVEGTNPFFSSQSGVLFDKLKTKLVAYPIGNPQRSFSIPEGVTEIGSNAFYRCGALQNVLIPASVVSIGDSAFYYCRDLVSITFAPESRMTRIGNQAFYCSGIRSISIPSSVKTIGEKAFYECIYLSTVTFEGGSQLNGIGADAFSYCSDLESILIPAIVSSIGDRALDNCEGLFNISVDESNPFYSSADGVLFDKAKTTLIAYPADKPESNYVIPSGVTGIARLQFANCNHLQTISFPTSVTYIDDSAFSYCLSLITVTFEAGSQLNRIGANAFSGCKNLAHIVIPANVEAIGNNAFSDCISLTSFSIPSNLISLGNGTFFDCTGISMFIVDENNSHFSSQDGVLFNKEKTDLIAFPAGKSEESFSIPLGVTNIGRFAFYRSGLSTIVIPSSVTFIGDGAFVGCSSLTSITVPSSVTEIGNFAFESCSQLTSITIPSSVARIGNYAFAFCGNLTNVIFESDSRLTNIGEWAFYGCGELEAFSISPSVTAIGSGAFYECIGLVEISIPVSVTSMGERVFEGCGNISINIAAESLPGGWNSNWNPNNRPVVWGYDS